MTNSSCPRVGLLWLSDLHCGQAAQKWLWPTLDDEFFGDLCHMHERTGPWHVIMFTGDLVFSGLPDQFAELNKILMRLKNLIEEKQGSSPVLVTVPGNHDLARPNQAQAAVAALRHWHSDERIRKAFWDDTGSEYVSVIKSAFSAYTDWQATAPFGRPSDLISGILPGDFSATVPVEDIRLGIVGLNSSFLQLSGEDYQGKLHMDLQQFNYVCRCDHGSWFQERDFSLLLTHHPSEWLGEESKKAFRGGIYKTNRFAAHFFGHQHEPSTTGISEGGSADRLFFQAPSLFGLEQIGQAFDKGRPVFGYTVIQISDEAERGSLLIWPRRATFTQSDEWRIGPNPEMHLVRGTEHMKPIEIPRSRTKRVGSRGCGFSDSFLGSRRGGGEQEGRRKALEQALRESVSRCAMRWQAAGVSSDLAATMAHDRSITSLNSDPIIEKEKRIVLLMGPAGSGKSLAAERLHQRDLEIALENPQAPTPVYLESDRCAGHLVQAVRSAVERLNGDTSLGASVTILEPNGGETADIASLLNEARVLVNSLDNTRVVMTSRDSPSLQKVEETVRIPELTETESHMLISRVLGKSWSPGIRPLPKSVSSTIRRPLFAILLANFLRNSSQEYPASKSDLIGALVDHLLKSPHTDVSALNSQLEAMAVHIVDRSGGYVPLSDISPRMEAADIDELCKRGLLLKRSQTVAFPLAVLAEWFAARSLLSASTKTADLVEDNKRLDRWFSALSVAIGLGSHEEVDRILAPIVDRDPGFASILIKDGLADWGLSDEVPPPIWRDCGDRILRATRTWLNAFEGLAARFGPVASNGNLMPLGVRAEGAHLISGWYSGSAIYPALFELPFRPKQGFSIIRGGKLLPDSYSDRFISRSEWNSSGWATKQSRPGRQSGWAWRWTQEDLRAWLSAFVKARQLDLGPGLFETEAVWAGIEFLARGRVQLARGIDLSVVERAVLDAESRGITTLESASIPVSLTSIKSEISRLSARGELQIRPPCDPSISAARHGLPALTVGADMALLETRLKTVFESVMSAYSVVANRDFPRLVRMMSYATMMPSRLVARIYVSRTGTGRDILIVHRRFQPLPLGEPSVADVSFSGEVPAVSQPADDPEARLAVSRFRALRPSASEKSPIKLGGAGVIDDFVDNSAATKMFYEWLLDDLKSIHWAE